MLYALAPDMSVVPDLATGLPAISADGLTWTVRLRHNGKWTDGKPITADDVVYTVNTQRDPTRDKDPNAIFVWDKLDRVEKVDDYTVRFVLTERYAPFLANSLATFVAPAHVYGVIPPSTMRSDPIGSSPTVTGGPFKFDRRIAGQEIDLSANPDYYGGRPRLDRIVFRVIPDPTTAANSLLDGEVNWQPDAPLAEAAKLKGSGTFVRRYPDTGYYDVRFNDRPDHVFGDVRVRQAFAYAIDKEALVKEATSGNGTTMWGDLLPTSWAYDDAAVVRYKQDLDHSRRLLQAAGWTPGPDGILTRGGKRLTANLLVRSDADVRVRAANLIAQKVRAVGIELKVQPTDFGVFFDPLKAGTFDAALTGFATAPDPDGYYIFHSSQLRPEHSPSGVNWSGYSNPELDHLIEQERGTLTSDAAQTRSQRRAIFSQVERILGNDVVTYFLWSDNTVQGFDVRVGGVQPGTLINLDYDRAVQPYATWYLGKQ
jgi:peptide/nickel transport system substrate-binding protein